MAQTKRWFLVASYNPSHLLMCVSTHQWDVKRQDDGSYLLVSACDSDTYAVYKQHKYSDAIVASKAASGWTLTPVDDQGDIYRFVISRPSKPLYSRHILAQADRIP